MTLTQLMLSSLYAVTILVFVANLISLVKQIKQVKAQGQSPLVMRSLTAVILSAVVEAAAATLVVVEANVLGLLQNNWSYPVVFTIAYLFRNLAAYLSTWFLYAMFIKVEARRMKKQIEKDKEEAL